MKPRTKDRLFIALALAVIFIVFGIAGRLDADDRAALVAEYPHYYAMH